MLVIAFVAFVLLLVAWLVAPNGELERPPLAAAPAPAPALKVGEARA